MPHSMSTAVSSPTLAGLAGLAVLVAAAAGCGPESKSLDQSETQLAWTQITLIQTNGELEILNQQLSGSGGGEATYEYDCENGGTATFEGTYAKAQSSSGGSTKTTTDMTIDFADCNSGQLTIDGKLDYLTEDAEQAKYEMSTDYSGDLTFTGSITGGCKVDMVEKTKPGTSLEDAADYRGTVCGHDAEATLSTN